MKRSQKVMPLDIKSLTRLKADLVHLDNLNRRLDFTQFKGEISSGADIHKHWHYIDFH